MRRHDAVERAAQVLGAGFAAVGGCEMDRPRGIYVSGTSARSSRKRAARARQRRLRRRAGRALWITTLIVLLLFVALWLVGVLMALGVD